MTRLAFNTLALALVACSGDDAARVTDVADDAVFDITVAPTETFEPTETVEDTETFEDTETVAPTETVEDAETSVDATADEPDVPGCSARSYVFGAAPELAVYTMFDQSGSMSDGAYRTPDGFGVTRWDAAVAAMKTFLTRPDLQGMSIGIQYFGLSDDTCDAYTVCDDDSDCGPCGPCFSGVCAGYLNASDSCDAADYATPEIAIGPVVDTGPLIAASLDAHRPSTQTPTSAALTGLIDHTRAWALAHPNQRAVALLVTDGEPGNCDTNIDNIAAIAAAGVSGSPPVRTFVLGIGIELASLDRIAAAGGTGQAVLVDASGDIGTTLAAALANAAELGLCTLAAPEQDGAVVDPRGGVLTLGASTLPEVADASACTADGWYVTSDEAGTRLTLCPASCQSYRGSEASLTLMQCLP